eukprot:5851933-Pyramimonas_sp.AAC.1
MPTASVLGLLLNTLAPWLYERNCNDPYELRDDPEDTTGLLGADHATTSTWDVAVQIGGGGSTSSSDTGKSKEKTKVTPTAEPGYGAAATATYHLAPVETEENDLPELVRPVRLKNKQTPFIEQETDPRNKCPCASCTCLAFLVSSAGPRASTRINA